MNRRREPGGGRLDLPKAIGRAAFRLRFRENEGEAAERGFKTPAASCRRVWQGGFKDRGMSPDRYEARMCGHAQHREKLVNGINMIHAIGLCFRFRLSLWGTRKIAVGANDYVERQVKHVKQK